jgi:hypothetical protein
MLAQKLIGFAYYTRGLFGFFVAAVPPVNADVSVSEPGLRLDELREKDVRVNHG